MWAARGLPSLLNLEELFMVRRTRLVIAFALLPAFVAGLSTALSVVPTEAQSPSGGNPVLGTWKLKSFVREVTATGEKAVTPLALEERAECWRPFRGYAVFHLWAADHLARNA